MKEEQIKAIMLPWIVIGYETFALHGPVALKVERLADQVGKNKSSFYHHFADMEVFIELLLTYHLIQSKEMAKAEAACKTEDAFILILVHYKLDLLFNRQLRIHRENPAFEACFIHTNQVTSDSFIPLWVQILELQDHMHLATLFLNLTLENFFLQITSETLNEKWLKNYFGELKASSRAFKKSGKIPSLNSHL